jgi:hypothetical protein
MKRYAQFGVGDVEVCGGTKEFVEQCAPLVVAAGVVRFE